MLLEKYARGRDRRELLQCRLFRPRGRNYQQFMVTRIGSLATTSCEPGQAWKGAAAAVDLGAGVWLVRAASISFRVIRQLLYNPFSYPEAADYS